MGRSNAYGSVKSPHTGRLFRRLDLFGINKGTVSLARQRAKERGSLLDKSRCHGHLQDGGRNLFVRLRQSLWYQDASAVDEGHGDKPQQQAEDEAPTAGLNTLVTMRRQ